MTDADKLKLLERFLREHHSVTSGGGIVSHWIEDTNLLDNGLMAPGDDFTDEEKNVLRAVVRGE